MAKNYLEELLGKNERILLKTRQHWFILFSSIALEILLIVILIGAIIAIAVMMASPLVTIGFVLVLIPLGGMLRDIIIWYKPPVYCHEPAGHPDLRIFSKNVVDSSLEKVNDVKMNQSFPRQAVRLRRCRDHDRQRNGKSTSSSGSAIRSNSRPRCWMPRSKWGSTMIRGANAAPPVTFQP